MKTILAACLPDLGHLLPTLAVLERLPDHRVVVATVPEREDLVRARGLEPRLLAPDLLPAGWLREADAARAGATGPALQATDVQHLLRPFTTGLLAGLPTIAGEVAPDLFVIDPYCHGAVSVAQAAGCKAILLEPALSAEPVPGFPDPFAPWPDQKRPPSRSQTILAALRLSGRDRLLRPVLQAVNPWRRHHDLESLRTIAAEFAGLERIHPLPPGFELQPTTGANHHGCGAFLPAADVPAAGFPWDRLDDRPLVYAPLGTMAARKPALIEALSAASTDLAAQLVVSLGRPEDSTSSPTDQVLTVPWAPQLALLERAAVCVTRAGLATTLEALWHGVPLLALPFGRQEPGVALRIRRARCGIVVPPEEATWSTLGNALRALLADRAYGENARRLGDEMRTAGGADRAAKVIARLAG